ncbi:hypothetical protein L6164_016980 [Bauhinia variegata]|uniref:Uncharacterized protein n=1 Tax=Bauhinia variegata TaxID=167791 RepID=A0ACB9N6C5_BAUVA|nr:hypothetical protein L6164_016980 [Bauhinia variegata]
MVEKKATTFKDKFLPMPLICDTAAFLWSSVNGFSEQYLFFTSSGLEGFITLMHYSFFSILFALFSLKRTCHPLPVEAECKYLSFHFVSLGSSSFDYLFDLGFYSMSG